MADTCEAWRLGFTANVFQAPPREPYGAWYDRCVQPATHRVSSGCVHEHVLSWDVCDDCADMISDQGHGGDQSQCAACYDLHGTCPVVVAIEPLAMAVTR